MKNILRIIVITMMVALLPLNVFAVSGKPYKDVSQKSVGNNAYTAIEYVKAHKGYAGFVSGKKFHPNKKITRRQFIVMLVNFYGADKVPVTIKDVIGANKKATPKWATAKMVEVAKNCGVTIVWNNNSKKGMSRALASQYLSILAHFDKAFKPLK